MTVPRQTTAPGYRSANQIFIASAPVEVGPQVPGLGTVGVGVVGRSTLRKVAAQGGRLTVGLACFPTPDLSAPFTHVTVARNYDLATGDAPSGTVSFTPSAWLVNNGVTVVPAPVVAVLDTEGRIAIALVVNDDPATTPADSYYTVLEEILGQPRRSYRITIPSDVAGFTVDLGYLESADPDDPTGGSGYGLGGYGTSPYGGG